MLKRKCWHQMSHWVQPFSITGTSPSYRILGDSQLMSSSRDYKASHAVSHVPTLGQPALIGASYPSKKPSVFGLFSLTNAASHVDASARGRAAWNTFSKLEHNGLSSHYYCCNAWDLGALNHVAILKLCASDLLLPTVFFIVILFILCSIEYLENIQQLLTAIVKKVPLIAEKSKQCMKRLCFVFSVYQQNASRTL